jgi:hypothetical protein
MTSRRISREAKLTVDGTASISSGDKDAEDLNE